MKSRRFQEFPKTPKPHMFLAKIKSLLVKSRMLAFKTLKPMLNRVVIKKAEAVTKTKAGIILTSAKQGEQLNQGTVVAIGPGKQLDNGTVRPVSVKVGDTVLLPEYGGSKVVLADEQELFIYRDEDIIGTLHDPTK